MLSSYFVLSNFVDYILENETVDKLDIVFNRCKNKICFRYTSEDIVSLRNFCDPHGYYFIDQCFLFKMLIQEPNYIEYCTIVDGEIKKYINEFVKCNEPEVCISFELDFRKVDPWNKLATIRDLSKMFKKFHPFVDIRTMIDLPNGLKPINID